MKTCPQCSTGYPDSLTTCPTHSVPLNEIRDLKPGMIIHQSYRIVRKLGQGGMGAVYLAQHTLMNEPQALKFLSNELSQDHSFTSRFLREVRTLRQIRHKNVVDAGNLEPAEDGTLFFSMEFVDGPDLRGLMHTASGPFPVPLALSITRGIAEGLGAAHAKGMVHRDIKPENILMARDGDSWLPKIADFGIVATKESSTAYTRTGGTLLTMAYAAPEQWRGTPAAQLDGRTDLYALGGLLYEMLTGRSPFHAENYEGWALQHQTTPPQPPSALRPDLANWHGLDALVLRLLAKDREDRPRDVAELLNLLDAVRYLPPEAHRETEIDGKAARLSQKIAGESPKPARRWGFMFGLLAVVLILSALAVWFISQRSKQTKTNKEITFNLSEAKPVNSAQQPARSTVEPIEQSGGVIHGLPAGAVVEPIAPPKTLPSGFNGWDAIKQEPSKLSVQKVDIAEIEKQADALVKQNRFSEAFPLYEQTCAGGRAGSCNHLGAIYLFGTAGTKDDLLAAAFFKKACDADYVTGCANLADMYRRGEGLAMDATKAAALYSKACEGGLADCCNSLGVTYVDGDGVAKDVSRAVTLFFKACNAGDADGCANLGNSYRIGRGVEQDSEKARQFLTKGCNMGNQWGCDRLKEMQ